MSKRKKTGSLQPDKYSFLECEPRPVKEQDKWCQRKMKNGEIPVGEAPWGYIITIPFIPGQNTFLENVDGVIVRSKIHCGKLLIQVVNKENAPKYGVKSFSRQESNNKQKESKEKNRKKGKKKNKKKNKKNKKKLYRITHIKNLSKRNW